LPTTGILNRISVVLCRPRYGGNIGAAARAVKNMGIGGLVLVAPERYSQDEARMLASNASDVLEGASTFDTIEEAINGCEIVFGASRRIKSHRIRIMTPRESAAHIVGHMGEGSAAIIFGPEDNGLTSEELARCHGVISIPADDKQPSLNLAQAIMVIAYELRMGVDGLPSVRSFGDASESEFGQVMEQAEAVLEKSGFFLRNPKDRVLLHLKEILTNGVSTSQDARVVRGIFRRIAWALEREEGADNIDPGE
jgi:TrmH family RNA methyltransferase